MIVFVGGVDKRLAKHFFEESSTLWGVGLVKCIQLRGILQLFSNIFTRIWDYECTHKHVHLWWRCTK